MPIRVLLQYFKEGNLCYANVACGLKLGFTISAARTADERMFLYHPSVGEFILGKNGLFITIQGVDPILLSELLAESEIDPVETPSKIVVRDGGEVSPDTEYGSEKQWCMLFKSEKKGWKIRIDNLDAISLV